MPAPSPHPSIRTLRDLLRALQPEERRRLALIALGLAATALLEVIGVASVMGLIAVVMGGPSAMMRDGNVTDLLDTGFEVLHRRALGQFTTVAANFAEPDDLNDAVMDRLASEDVAADGAVAGAAPTAATALGTTRLRLAGSPQR